MSETRPGSRRRRLLLGLLAAGLGPALASCSRPKDPVEALLSELEEAAEARDAARFGERLSASLRAGTGMDRAQAQDTLRRYFAAYQSVALTVYGVEVERAEGSARVRCVVEFVGEARKLGPLQGLLPPEAAYRFDLEVADEDGVWRLRAASWTPVAPSAAP